MENGILATATPSQNTMDEILSNARQCMGIGAAGLRTAVNEGLAIGNDIANLFNPDAMGNNQMNYGMNNMYNQAPAPQPQPQSYYAYADNNDYYSPFGFNSYLGMNPQNQPQGYPGFYDPDYGNTNTNMMRGGIFG